MADAITPITFGGVQFNGNEIANKAEVPSSAYGGNDYVVNFKSGATLMYPNQPARNETRATSKINSVLVETSVNNMYGGSIYGSPKMYDKIKLTNCEKTVADVRPKEKGDIQVETVEINGGKYNGARLGQYDEASINGKKFGKYGPLLQH